MKKILFSLILLFLTISNLGAHTSHYKGIKVINMEVFRNENLIGYSNYFFTHGKNSLEVKNYTQFKVKLFNVVIFSVSSEALEKYKNDQLIFYNSITFQNDKEKYVKLKYDELNNKIIIDGSSFKGKARADAIIGNWWNHKILKVDKQISPISGSVKEQEVTYVGKENVKIYDKNYLLDHYKLVSKKKDLPEDKRLDFDIWLNPENNLIFKVLYNKKGKWEYRLKSFEIN
tara:strand:- start:456 stop:1145 length:690 start_codon:yes stop_codon:yes gene_type:complete